MEYMLSIERWAVVSRRQDIISTLLGFLPQVQRPNHPIPLREKYFYTVASVSIFMAASQLPLYGVQLPLRGPDPFYWARLSFAANWGTLMTFGILPVILPEAIVQVLGPVALDVTTNYDLGCMFLDGAQKLLGIFITILAAIGFALFSVIVDKVGIGVAVLIMLQVFFSGVAVIYLDEVLKKGYGLLPSTSLFTATNICVSVLWKAFSPNYEQSAEFEGAVIAFYRQNLPNVINLLATSLFCLIVIFFQGFSVVLPERYFQFNYRLKLSYISYAAIILQHVLSFLMLSILEMFATSLVGKLKGYNTPSGKSYTFTWLICRDPAHVFLYILFMLASSPLFSLTWLVTCLSSPIFRLDLLEENGEPRMTRAQPDYMSENEIWSHICKAAYLGTGIMLAVAAVYPYFGAGKPRQTGILGL